MNTKNIDDIEARLAIFLKPEFMPVTAKQLNEWVIEAENNGGDVEIPRMMALSGAHQVISL